MPVEPRDAPDSAFEVSAEVVNQGFRSEYRLSKTDEFSSVFAFRKVLRGEHFNLLYRPNTGPSARIGVVIAKKFVRSAVNRNLIKRIVRESFRLSRNKLAPQDIVVRISKPLAGLDRRTLRGEIDELLACLAQ